MYVCEEYTFMNVSWELSLLEYQTSWQEDMLILLNQEREYYCM